jgi:hypothetical protein
LDTSARRGSGLTDKDRKPAAIVQPAEKVIGREEIRLRRAESALPCTCLEGKGPRRESGTSVGPARGACPAFQRSRFPARGLTGARSLALPARRPRNGPRPSELRAPPDSIVGESGAPFSFLQQAGARSRILAPTKEPS